MADIFRLTLFTYLGYTEMKYRVLIKKAIVKKLKKLPAKEYRKFDFPVQDLEERGPVLPNWLNFSKLGENEYHCHLSRSWVACWRREKRTLLIEVYYVGSREKAPY